MNKLGDYILTFFKGVCMGAADIVPGVSGGTMALITGIYTRLIDAIDYVASFFSLETLDLSFENFMEKIRGVDWALFVPLLLGIGAAAVSLSSLLHRLLNEHTALTFAFFFGVIAASAFYMYSQLKLYDKITLLSSLLGAGFAFFIVGLNALAANHSLPILFGSGAVAICAMILPGISGAFILLLLNQYEYVLGAIKSFRFLELLIVGVGAVTGLMLFSRLLHYLLHEHRNKTMGFLIGLMVGSLRLPVEEVWAQSFNIAGVIVSALGGFAIVFVLEKGLGKS